MPKLIILKCASCGKPLGTMDRDARANLTRGRRCPGCGVYWKIGVHRTGSKLTISMTTLFDVHGSESMMP